MITQSSLLQKQNEWHNCAPQAVKKREQRDKAKREVGAIAVGGNRVKHNAHCNTDALIRELVD